MSGFHDRERGFEEKFAREQDQTFRAHARADKMLGLWVAEKMGLSGDEADTYAMTLVKADLREPGDEDVIGQAVADLAAKGCDVGFEEVKSKLHSFQAAAQSE
ncbi:MAG: DUF1476 domain-containing protein [Planctomycetes bacterium]|jgi:hypothetical protein|nr:DUF1476 domain-containing protein [Planctomycetota bacterium]MCP4839993.1 DUF1476 domain-containing protein [Planctomycetota bacterium]